MPGATPQSTIAVILFSFASLSSSKAFSGKKEISTIFFLERITASTVLKPIKPGTAVTTKSNGRKSSG